MMYCCWIDNDSTITTITHPSSIYYYLFPLLIHHLSVLLTHPSSITIYSLYWSIIYYYLSPLLILLTSKVLLELNPNDGWTTCFKVPNVQLPIKRGFLGFTAATGEAHSRHDILSITAAKIDKAQAERFMRGQVFRMTERVRGGHFLGLLVVVSVVGGLYYLYTTNRKKTRF